MTKLNNICGTVHIPFFLIRGNHHHRRRRRRPLSRYKKNQNNFHTCLLWVLLLCPFYWSGGKVEKGRKRNHTLG